jgi:hypothetical protein
VAEAAASAPPCRVRRSRRMVGKSYMIYIYDTGGAYGAPFAWPWQLHLLLSATAAAWPAWPMWPALVQPYYTSCSVSYSRLNLYGIAV